ncbi:SLC7A1 (predicted) [Pycnogonum litorale]
MACHKISKFISLLFRKKSINYEMSGTNELSRCLSIFDLSAIGVGSTLGLGVYILSGQIAATKAGPAVILSFAIAAIASVFSGLCYAEFGAIIPKAGSAYVYSYVTVGEFVAFVIGWNMILEYIIGAASVARGYSGYVDAIFNDSISNFFHQTMPINVPHLSHYPDMLAFCLIFFVAVLLALGVKASSRFNNVFTTINLLVATFVVIAGAFKADGNNWRIKKDDIPSSLRRDSGEGGFFPYGVAGMMSGAASCFYAFVGFDVIATAGEEVKNPKRAIPIAIIVCLSVSSVAYISISIIQTLVVPYYLQNNEHPLSYVFEYIHWPIAKWVVNIGALAGLSASIMGALFPLPRVVYSMASDGLIFRWLATINKRFQTPFIATILAGLFGGLMAMLFDVQALASMMSIGTLSAYSLVALSVLILRYMSEISDVDEDDDECRSHPAYEYLMQLTNQLNLKQPNVTSSKLSRMLLSCIAVSAIGFSSLLLSLIISPTWWKIMLFIVFSLILVSSTLFLWLQPRNDSSDSFQVPGVPFVPVTSIIINLYLMSALDSQTWIRFTVWMILGLTIYFGYGISYRSETDRAVILQCVSDSESDVVQLKGSMASKHDSDY